MTTLIDMGLDEHTGIVLNQTGDLAIVFESPSRSSDYLMPCSDAVINWIDTLELGDRLSGLFLVTRTKKKDNKTPLRELRLGWKRVLGEIQIITPNVKRLLVFCKSELINAVIFPELKGDHSTPGIEDFHGTIFTLDCGLELVPTFHERLPHTAPWIDQDINRWRNLAKPSQPLTYSNNKVPRAADEIVVDLETTGLKSWADTVDIMGLQWSDNDRSILTGNFEWAWDHLANLMLSGTIVWMHNKQFDIGFATQKFRDADAVTGNCRCTMLRARADGEIVAGLKHLGILYSDRPGNYAWITSGEQFEFNNPAYLCEDLATTWALVKRYKNNQSLVIDLADECALMVAEQTLAGSKICPVALEAAVEDARIRANEMRPAIIEKYGIDPSPGNDAHLAAVLEKMGYPVQKNPETGRYKLNKAAKENFGLQDVIDYQHTLKIDSTFVTKTKKMLRDDGTVSHQQNILGADSGRTTMTNSIWQTAPRKGPVRGLLVSRFEGGSIWYIDLAQNEIRTGAYISDDDKMAEWANLEDGHRATAADALGKAQADVTKDERDATKTLLFRKMYMGRAYTDLQKRVEKFLEAKFHKYFDWAERIGNKAMKTLSVTDAWGLRRDLRRKLAMKGKWAVKRSGGNSPVQGLASHFAMWLTVRVWKKFKALKMRSLVLFGVHDAMVGDCFPGEEQLIVKCVSEAFIELGNIITKQFKLANTLPLMGGLVFDRSWGACCADNADRIEYMCSTLGGLQ